MADNQQYGPLAQKPESAKDIRRVVANATRTKGKGLTIANKDELNNRKQEEQIANNVNKGVSKGTVAPVSSSTPKVTLQPTQPQPIGPVKPNTDLFKNPQLGPINNIQVIKQDNQAQNIQNNNNGQDNFINTHGRATELKTPIDIDNALMDLYSDIKEKINRNELNNVNVQGLKQAYSEFTNMDDEVVTSLVSDIASMINKKLPFSVDNMKKLKSLYPELASAAWGFDVGGGQNMYQGGGLKETLSSGSPTDLNKRGPIGVAAETVLNPLGQATTVLDSASQSIGQVDNNTDKILGWDIKSTPELKQALSKVVSDEKLLNKYYEEYQNYVKEHGVLSNLYTDFYEGDTLVEKLWNVARGKKKVNVDAGFKSWLVDKVNNQVNGWQGEFWGAANQLNDVQGPNVAKMYSNVPASTVKTATAITRAITNPVDTVSGLVHLIGTEEGHQALAARYGSWEAFANAIEQDPVGTSSDALAVVEGGASATRAVASLGTKGALSASIATEMLGAARTSESLFKIASRLEKLSSKAGAIEKIAGTSSNLGVDIPLKGGMVQIGKETKVINGIIKGLREWGESGDSMIKKVAKYSADRSEQGIGKIAKDTKDFLKEGPVNSLANKLMGTASDTDKLFKAANPNINTLRNTTDYKNKRANMDLATKTIVESGYTPKTISEWAKAHAATLNKKWNEFKQLIKDKADVEVDSSEVLHEIKDFIKREKEGATVNQRGDIRALELEVQDLERRGKLSMDVIENKKEHYNSSWKDSEKMKKGDIYEKGVKILGNSMRKVQDNILGKGPESTKALRQQIKALMDTKEDIYKADVRNQKKKSDIAGGGVIESYGRLAGVGDILKGGLQLLGNPGEGLANIGKGAGKVVFGKAMGKARDVDYLTKKGFEGLSKKNKKPSSEGLREKMQERRELSELRDKKKELDKKYKEGKISDDEYLKQSEEVEYGIAQKRARLSVIGDKEMKMDSKTRAKMVELVKKRAKDVGFTTEVMDGMEKDTQGYTDLQKKLIALEKNPGDTTAQHELFHAFFSVVDNKTKTYILDEAKKILKEKGLSDINAEEWLAESFGIYAKRQQIKLGLIDAPKGFKAKLRDFFQRVYEFMQRFNGDRGTINKLFDEILGDRKMKNGIMDLSDLLGNKKVNERTLYGGRGEGLRNKSVYHGSHADFDKFDSSHMGEGEGNQAHGWGHYVAVDKKTAERYADMKNPSNYEYKGRGLKDIEKELWDSKPGEKIELIPIKHMLDSDWMGRYQRGERFDVIKNEGLKDAKKSLDYSKRIYEENPKGKGVYMTNKERYEIDKRLYDAWNNLDKKDFDFEKPNRNLYTNEIPDPKKADTPTGSNYLEEGKGQNGEYINQKQLNKFVDAIEKEKEVNPELKKRLDSNFAAVRTAVESLRTSKEVAGGYLYSVLESAFGSPKAASKFLEKLGYDGIHYFGGRDGEAYVIFNDDALKIKDHIRYKKKIGDKEVEINKDITSPDQMAKINSKGLSVIHDFISEKQAEKALDVSKDILDENGNAYLWTHTNKYNDKMFSQFENTRDSKYLSFKDNQIGWLTNSEDMSKSYADQKSKLAPTKKFNSVQEVNDYFKKNPIVQKWQGFNDTENERTFKYRMEKAKDLKGNDYWKLESQKSEKETYDNIETMWNAFKDSWMDGNLGEMPKNIDVALKILKDKRFGDATELKVLKNGKIEKIDTYDWTYVEGYNTDQQAIAEGYAKGTDYKAYHYQGIAQNMKNPLVVDTRNPDGTQTYWNKLGNGYEFLEKNNKEGLDKAIKVIDELKKQAEPVEKAINEVKEKIGNKVTGKALLGIEGLAKRFIEDALKGTEPFGVKEEWMEKGREFINNNPEYKELYDRAKEIYNNNKDIIELKKGFKYESNYEIKDYLKSKGVDGGVAGILRGIGSDSIADINIKDYLKDYNLETNDYVFYALSKGGYDGVLFKNISDYGGESNIKKGGDVLAIFNSKQFKSWDNANPTDSKYISYKKNVSLDKKSEGLQKKNSSGLLAKGRDRTLGNDGLRYKKELRDLTLNNEKKEGAYDPRAWLPKVRVGWTKAKIEKIIKEPLTGAQRGVSAALQAIQEFDSPEEFRAHTFYHGTQGSFVGKPSMSIPEKTFDKIADRLGGGYGERYWAISLTTDKKIASNFGGASDHVNINPIILRKNAKVIEMPKLSDSVELEDHIEQLWNDGVDAVWIGDKNAGEKELAVLNPRAIVNLDAPEYYRQYHLGRDDNPLRIKSDEDFDRIYNNVGKYREQLRDASKFGGLKEKWEIDNYGRTAIDELLHGDMEKYRGMEKAWKDAPEKAQYDKMKSDYEGLKRKIKDEIRFKKKSEVPEDKKLVGLHNLGIDKLRGVIELGGMPMPSIAVTKKGVPHESYGDITFIMKESAINPGLNSKNKIYQFDAYTPMVPNAEPILKNDAWTKQQIEMISKATGASKYEIKEWAQDEYKGRGLVDDYPKLKDFEYLLPEITEKKMFAGWNSRGGKKYKDYTMNNIIKRMKEQGNQSFFSQFNKMVAQEGGSMQNLDGLRDRKFGPKDQELWDKKRNEYTNAIQEIFEKYKGKIRGENGNIDGFKWDELNRFQELLEDSYSKSDEKWLDEVAHKGWAHSIPEMKIEDIQRIRKILKDMSDVQRPYSEAKPERAIRFDEVGAVVAPEGKLKEVKDMLKDTGLKVYGYKEGERMSVVDKVADDNGLRFKKKVDQTQTPEFKKWFGDWEKGGKNVSKVVNSRGEPLEVYHGTSNGDFTVFEGDAFFTDDYWNADGYANGERVVDAYLDIKNPLVIDAKGAKWDDLSTEYGTSTREVVENVDRNKYDGVIFENIADSWMDDVEGGESTVYVTFRPEQIKSSTENIGTFDKNNPDIRYKKGLEKKESGLEKKDVRYKLNTKGFTPGTRLTTKDFDEMKTRNISFIKTKDWTNGKDTLRRVKNKIQQDLGINVIDGMRITSSSINHVYNSHGYDTELGYGKSVTKQDLTKIPDILENYSTISNTTDSNGNPTNNFILTKDYGGDRYNLVIEVVNLNNGGKQIGLKTFYINDAQGRAKFAQDKRNGVVKNNRKKAKQQYGGRINL